jgi:hypothetical protein
LDAVVTDVSHHAPPEPIFGPEPDRGWCFTYQTADLARQRGAWDEIPVLLKDALAHDQYPNNSLEWMPFLQAFAKLDEAKEAGKLAKLLTLDKFQRVQSCEIMTTFMEEESIGAETKSVIEKQLCK